MDTWCGGDNSESEADIFVWNTDSSAGNTISASLSAAEAKASAMPRGKEQAFFYREEIVKAMEKLRKPADELEKIVGKEYWPFPTYADLIFEV